MTELVPSRLDEARQLVADIRAGLEEFYHTGMKLLRLSNPALYGALGYETFEKCCKGEFDWSRDYAYRLIKAAEYRSAIPNVDESSTPGAKPWTEWTVRPLTRLPDKRDAVRVAKKVLK